MIIITLYFLLFAGMVASLFYQNRLGKLSEYKRVTLNKCIEWDSQNEIHDMNKSSLNWCFDKLPENKKVIWSITPISDSTMLTNEMKIRFDIELDAEDMSVPDLEKQIIELLKTESYEEVLILQNQINEINKINEIK